MRTPIPHSVSPAWTMWVSPSGRFSCESLAARTGSVSPRPLLFTEVGAERVLATPSCASLRACCRHSFPCPWATGTLCGDPKAGFCGETACFELRRWPDPSVSCERLDGGAGWESGSGGVGGPGGVEAGTDPGVAGVSRNRAYNKSIQEDVAQKDVNSVTDRVDWRHNGRCVRPLRRSDSTYALGFTGWSLVGYKRTKVPRRCGETTISTYAKFKGGHRFPFCVGFKVTTIYASNFMQGFPSGKGGYYVYHVTGGAPCHKSLHWDGKRGNKRIY